MGLNGECEVIRVDLIKDKILLALEFKNISYDTDNIVYSRKAYRKKIKGHGKILLNGNYCDFDTVNVSGDGLMIQLNEFITLGQSISIVANPQPWHCDLVTKEIGTLLH